MFIVIDGMDGAGKNTIVTSIQSKLMSFVIDPSDMVIRTDFPLRNTQEVNDYLNDKSNMTAEEFQQVCLKQREEESKYILKKNYIGSQKDHYIAVRWSPSGIVYSVLDEIRFKYPYEYKKLNFDLGAIPELIDKYKNLHKNIVLPDIGFILVCDPKIAISRIHDRGKNKEVYENELHLIWAKKLFKEYYLKGPDPYFLLDTTQKLNEYFINLLLAYRIATLSKGESNE